MNLKTRFRTFCLATASFTLAAHGATWYWDGNQSTINATSDNTSAAAMNWLGGGNWDNGATSAPLAVWTGGDIAVFGGTPAGTQTVTLGSTIAAGGLDIGSGYVISVNSGNFNAMGVPSGPITIGAGATLSANNAANNAHNIAGGAGLTLNGGTLTSVNGPGGAANDGGFGNWLLRGPVTVGGSSASTISSTTLYLGAGSGAFAVADATGSAASDLVISSAILAGSLGITKTGAGTLELTGANASANTVTVNGGLLKLAATGSLAGAVVANSGGGFRMVNTAAVTGTLTANAGGSIEVENSGATVWTKAVTGAGTFVKAGAGTLTVGSGILSVTGGMTVEAGTLDVTRTGGAAIPMPLTIKAGATFRITGNQYNNFTLPGGTITPATPGITVENGATLEAAGTVNNANNITGLILKGGSVINTGTPEPTYGTFIPRYITVSDFPSVINVPELSFANAALPLDVADTPGAIDLDILGPVTPGDGGGGNGGFVKTGGGTVRFGAAVSMNQPVAINGGKAVFNAASTLSGTFAVDNATLENAAQLNTGAATFTNNAVFTMGNHFVSSGAVSISAGAGVSTGNSFLSATAYNVTGGTLTIAATSGGAKLSGGTTVTIGNGGLVQTAGSAYNNVMGQNWIVETGGTLSAANTAQNAHNVGTVTLRGGTITSGAVTDGTYPHFIVNGGLTVETAPSQIISRSFGFNGNQTVTVNETGADVDLNVTARLRGNGPGAHGFDKAGAGKMRVQVGAAGLSGDYGGPVTVSAGELEIFNNTGNTGLSPLSTSAVTVKNGGTLSLAGNQFNALGSSGAYPSSITVEAGGTFAANSTANNAHNIGSLILKGGAVTAANASHGGYGNLIFNGSITQTVDAPSTITAPEIAFRSAFGVVDVADTPAADDLTITSNFIDHDGPAPLIKNGAGSLKLTGASTYSGPTTVNAGTLELAGTGSMVTTSSISISGGTLLLSGSAANRLGDATPVSLGSAPGSRLQMSGSITESTGPLSLLSDSVIDMGGGTAVFSFSDSSAQGWTGTLSVWNWSGSLAGGGTDQLRFGANSSGLLPAQATAVEFYSGNGSGFLGTGTMLPSGEIVPVPEPSATFAGAALLLAATLRRSRKSAPALAAMKV